MLVLGRFVPLLLGEEFIPNLTFFAYFSKGVIFKNPPTITRAAKKLGDYTPSPPHLYNREWKIMDSCDNLKISNKRYGLVCPPSQ